ncbi:hypothetical protein AB0N65_11730 [Paenarthrobacter sp. NPDC089322]|uniref:hypothetical protein n=1 Tax=Paenarthrobacter sp. NPDC089322 TaxID=3155065 RepID=UPI00343F0CC4
MARIRTIKPDFWTDGKIVQLSAFARLLYIGMWNFTLCDHGHVADDSFKLKLQILPGDAVDVDALLGELFDAGRVVRITDAAGRTYLHVKRFEEHQKIDPRWKTRCPACAQQGSLEAVETQASFSELTETPDRSPTLSLGKEGKGRESKKTSSKPSASTDEFDAFWGEYPRKVGKEAAKKAFAKALRLTSYGTIMEGVGNLRMEVAGKDPKFTPHAATWLNAGRWDDEPEPPTQAIIPAAYGWANR